MRNIENPNLREIALQQMADIKNQLLLALLKLLDAQRELQVVATTTGVVDPSVRSESAAPTTPLSPVRHADGRQRCPDLGADRR